MIRFVYLDATGTLLRPWPSVGEVYARACKPHGLTAPAHRVQEAFHAVWGRRVQDGDDGLTRAGTDEEAARTWWRGLVDEVLDALAFTGDRRGCFAACYQQFALPGSWRVYDEVRPVIAALRQDGYRVGLLSNWDARLPALLAALDLASLFDTVVVSALEGLGKPDPAFFRLAVGRAGLVPQEVLHVGDHPRLDREAAARAGLHALLVDRRGGQVGDDCIGDLWGIPRWLAAQRHAGRSA